MNYRVDDEIYIAIVLTKSAFAYTFLDDKDVIKRYLPLADLFKSINESNVEDYKTKDSELEIELYNAIKKVSGRNSLAWTVELAMCAFNANLLIDANVLEHLLSSRLMYSISGLKGYQLCEEIEKYFDGDQVITREMLNEFTDYILKKESAE